MRRRTSIDWAEHVESGHCAVPPEAGMKHERIFMVVDFPAPLGPRKPTICPSSTVKRHVGYGRDGTVSLGQVLDLNHGGFAGLARGRQYTIRHAGLRIAPSSKWHQSHPREKIGTVTEMTRILRSSLRSRLLLLVLLALLPALVLILITAWEQRQLAAVDAQESALRLARVAGLEPGTSHRRRPFPP